MIYDYDHDDLKDLNSSWKILKYIYQTMLLYCLKCRKNTESKNPRVEKTKNGRIMSSSNYAVFNSDKSRFIKEQEASEIIPNLAKMLISILIVGPALF